MISLVFLFHNEAYIELPNGLIGWLGWLTLLGLTLFLQRLWWNYNQPWNKRRGWTFVALGLLIPLTSLVMPGIRLLMGGILPPPMVPREPTPPILMIFAALPWVLAGGFLGPIMAAGLGFFSGVFLSVWGTHSPFLPLELALLASAFAAAMQQRYRTLFFRAIRHPLLVATLLALIYPVLYLADSVFVAQGVLASRLDYALTYVGMAILSIGGSLLISGLFAEVIALALPQMWGSKGELRASPAERRLTARFLYGMAPLAFVLVITLMAGDWFVAGAAARQLLQGRVSNAAHMAAQNVPFLLETGQNLIMQLAEDEQLYTASGDALRQLLARDLRTVPYFSQLHLLDDQGKPVAGYPQRDIAAPPLHPEEQAGIKLALHGVPIQHYIISSGGDKPTTLLSFIAVVENDLGVLQGILIGRSSLSANPLAQSMLTSLASMQAMGGEGMLLDEDHRIMVHSDPSRIMTVYSGVIPEGALFFDDTAPDGTRQMVYVEPTIGRSWKVVLIVPAHYFQQLALNIAAPLLGMIVILSFVSIVLVRLGLRVVTASLYNLSVEANRMARGQLDQPLRVAGEDEVGQLGVAFEKMRASLKARLDELNRLLLVSQGVASTLELQGSLMPVLESALVTGAASARVVLLSAVVPDLNSDSRTSVSFGAGPAVDLYRNLDDQILSLIQEQDRLVITNLIRQRLLVFPPGYPRPQALLGLVLRHENTFYGALWLAYDEPHQFPDEELRYLTTLAGQAALAAANARLFMSAELGRQRLEAILTSTPDPVVVTDHRDRLLLANPAAWQIFGLGIELGKGQPIERVISQPALVELLCSATNEQQSSELTLDERIYLATASPVIADGRLVGRVCVLRDVTHFKELDTLKSEFVSTVSHDLRSPLTLIRGYATMLQMVGDLNDQQIGYVRKIVTGVESMARLVNNLLDLGRIEAGVGLQLEMVPVQDVIERVVSALQLQAVQKRVRLSCEAPQPEVLLVEADQALLQQAFHNLVENAIKYTDAGGQVSINLRVQQEQMVFAVRDTGVGIAPADQQRLFEKFYQVGRKGAKREDGSGLGLAIVKSIVERHGGRVWLESQLGRGSTFYLAIPLRQATPDA